MTTPIGSQFVGPYKLEGPAPDLAHPDVKAVYDIARRRDMLPFRTQGLVLDIGASYQMHTIRYFVTFTEDKNGLHVFHEASGEGYLFGPNDLEAFCQFIDVPIREQAERRPVFRETIGRPRFPSLSDGRNG